MSARGDVVSDLRDYYKGSTSIARVTSYSFDGEPAKVAVRVDAGLAQVSLSLTAAEAAVLAERLLEAVRAIPAAL